MREEHHALVALDELELGRAVTADELRLGVGGCDQVAVPGDAPRYVADVRALLRLQLSECSQRACHAGEVVHGHGVKVVVAVEEEEEVVVVKMIKQKKTTK